MFGVGALFFVSNVVFFIGTRGIISGEIERERERNDITEESPRVV